MADGSGLEGLTALPLLVAGLEPCEESSKVRLTRW